MPQSMTLWVNVPKGDVLAENTIKEPTKTPYGYGAQIQLCKPLCMHICRVYVVLVHPRDAEKTQDHVMHLEANSKTDN